MKTRVFKTAKELIEFMKEFEEKWADDDLYVNKTVDVNYSKLTVTLRPRNKNRTVDQECDKYIDRELGTIDSITDMKRAENTQRPAETKWMIQKPTTMTEETERRNK